MDLEKQILSILGLSKKYAFGSLGDLKTKKVVKETQILKLKGCIELSNQRRQELGVVPNQDYVINVDKKIGHQFALSKNEQGRIS